MMASNPKSPRKATPVLEATIATVEIPWGPRFANTAGSSPRSAFEVEIDEVGTCSAEASAEKGNARNGQSQNKIVATVVLRYARAHTTDDTDERVHRKGLRA